MNETLSYATDKRSRGRNRMRRRQVAIAGAVGLLAYVGAYAIAYANCGPAANMAYMCYPDWGIDQELTYRVFFPVYWVHTRMFGATRHTYDRPPISAEDMAAE